MSKKKENWGGLFNKKRFERLKEEDTNQLQKMSVKESINLMEELLDSGFVEECRRIQKEMGLDKWPEE